MFDRISGDPRLLLAPAGALAALLVGATIVGSMLIQPVPSPTPSTATTAIPTRETSPTPTSTPEVTTGRFVAAGSLLEGRAFHSALALPDGRVVVVGGEASHPQHALRFLDSIEVWDPVDRAFSSSGQMQRATWGFQVEGPSLFGMIDGRTLLIPTGCSCIPPPGTSPAQVWDPVSGAEPLENLLVQRDDFAATQLSDGRILIVGGVVGGIYDASTAAEVWDPVADAIEPTGPLGHARNDAVGTLLKDGRVLVVGGIDRVGEGADHVDTPVREAEIWDPASGTFSTAFTFENGPGSSSRHDQRLHALTLDDGRVLILGDLGARVWDPTANTLADAGSFPEPRLRFTATMLVDGRVLIAGGFEELANDQFSPLASTLLWDPVTGRFEAGPELAEPRAGHTATLLADGRLLIVGGSRTAGLTLDAVVMAELWEPVAAP